MRPFLAILLGKLIFALIRIFKLGGGFAAPGLYALKIDPDLIQTLVEQIPKRIIITGTNGKTTTSGMLVHLFKTSNLKIISNSTGSNLERGIASTLIKETSLFGKTKKDVAIWEVDEAAFNTLAPKISPNLVVFLNVFRDQLDRYGEVDSVVNKWIKTINKLAGDTQFLINADDGSLESLIKSIKVPEIYSVKGIEIGSEKDSLSKLTPRFLALHIKRTEDKLKFIFRLDDCQLKVTLPSIGEYNVYNATAALSAKFLVDGLSDLEAASLGNFKSAFGRHETIQIGSKKISIFLIKNPTGATAVLKSLPNNFRDQDRLLLVLNDNFADGTDVSWIWDINFEQIKISPKVDIIASGSRAYDLALRLKYAGFKNIEIEPDLEAAFSSAVNKTGDNLYILPTYTAMLELQKILVSKGVKKEYWKE